MKKKLLDYLNYARELNISELSTDEKQEIKASMLIQIQFFQHERLIHLIVTVCFALLEMLSLMLLIYYPSIGTIVFTALFLVLLIPYIGHYYLLENGVQELYEHYDKLFL